MEGPDPTSQPPDAEQPDGEPVEEAEGSTSPWPFRLLLVALILLPATAGGALTYTQYGQVNGLVGPLVGTGADSSEAEESKPIEYGALTQLKNLIINPAGSGASRYLMVSVGFEAEDPAVITEIEKKEIVLRDAIIKRLGRRTSEELQDVEQQEKLKEELRAAANDILGKGSVKRLYFTQYVMQ